MTVDIDSASVATEVAELLRDERFEDLSALFAPRLAAVVSAETVRVAWIGEIAKIGAVRTIGTPVVAPAADGLDSARVTVTCERGALAVHLAVDGDGRLHGLRLASADESGWNPPDYADPRLFTEREVTVGTGDTAVGATLTLPRGRGDRPGIVLVSSGPLDRDVTTGPNKPFKDLAWGLAARGVAVLRFDKLTYAHSGFESAPGFTMVEEYVPHTLAAAEILRRQPGVDPARVYVAGHSGGGKAAPRIAAADPAIAGVVLLAADTVPLPRSILRALDHIAVVEPERDLTEMMASTRLQVAATESPMLTPETPTAGLLFDWPASYWLDLREYDQVATAAGLGRPILIVQGGRDYQVTADEDLPGWEAGLAGTPEVTVRVYPAVDHMLYPGTGPSKPSDYARPNHVDPAVISDIADWVGAEPVRPTWRDGLATCWNRLRGSGSRASISA
ncbi:alpha/beta fold hydrolase [Nocardia sp. ET3-3]|uniref:Alpha/beta fold hydrolase n=1 Tax=Nocardia terrae TaxID=2675851 RepID=A0A7K1UQL2_9NOCA|nr:alpha/beta hydrolase [Nocardia terrae]MVU76632.1 alpha/beta fold hydrolase [Nocardia terrae]